MGMAPAVRTFEYRQPRLNASFGLEFCTGGRTVYGVCTDVSDGGISATFEEIPMLNRIGSLLLRHPRGRFALDAVVAHIEGEHVGLTFLCKTEDDQAVSEQFALTVSRPSHGW
jgi:hypothetical protein